MSNHVTLKQYAQAYQYRSFKIFLNINPQPQSINQAQLNTIDFFQIWEIYKAVNAEEEQKEVVSLGIYPRNSLRSKQHIITN